MDRPRRTAHLAFAISARAVSLGRVARSRHLCRWFVPVLRPEPDEHGQSFRLRPLDLSRSRDHCPGRGRVLHRISRLHFEACRAPADSQHRRRRRFHLLQRCGGNINDRRRPAPAGMVHLLASQYALDAHRSDFLHFLLFAGALPGIHTDPAAQPPVAQAPVVPGL